MRAVELTATSSNRDLRCRQVFLSWVRLCVLSWSAVSSFSACGDSHQMTDADAEVGVREDAGREDVGESVADAAAPHDVRVVDSGPSDVIVEAALPSTAGARAMTGGVAPASGRSATPS